MKRKLFCRNVYVVPNPEIITRKTNDDIKDMWSFNGLYHLKFALYNRNIRVDTAFSTRIFRSHKFNTEEE